MSQSTVLILPGWQGSGPLHWQMRWVALHGDVVVEQHDWMRPLRGDWLSRLDDVLSDLEGPVLLAAHSLGCIQVTAWAAVSAQTHKVKAALLVAPGDVEASNFKDVFSTWQPIVMNRLPFKSLLVGSQNDPFCTLERAQAFAKAWGSDFLNLGNKGHVNADSNLGDWPEGRAMLNSLMKEKEHGH
ncbi:MAG: alpha/beta hydrolase [Limnohabitans sp.]|jgi:predicted alpha/beta hydrolase family esterase|nr:alpha/beta hydrolase [Limnohabitans sp.]